MRIEPMDRTAATGRIDFRKPRLAVVAVSLLLAAAACGTGGSPGSGAAGRTEDGEERSADARGGHAGAGEHSGHEAGHEEEAAHADEIHLSEAQRANVEIRVAPAGKGSAAATVSAPATVTFDLDRVTKIGPRVQAKVVRVTKDLGDRVVTGETVAVLDSPDLGRARADYLTARAAFDAAEAHYRRDQPLAEEQIISRTALQESRAEFEKARAVRDAAGEKLRLLGLTDEAVRTAGRRDAPLSRYELKSPGPGVVQKRALTPGETLDANQTPIHVVDSSVMWVMVDAYEQAVPRLTVGQPVTLRVTVLPGETFEGRVDWISAALDETTRTVRLRAVVENRDRLLRAGMFGTADVHTGNGGDAALVPVDALQTLEGRQVVFVPAGREGAYRAIEVVPGTEGGGEVEIRRGLEPGEPVVVDGAFDLMSALTARGRSAAHSH